MTTQRMAGSAAAASRVSVMRMRTDFVSALRASGRFNVMTVVRLVCETSTSSELMDVASYQVLPLATTTLGAPPPEGDVGPDVSVIAPSMGTLAVASSVARSGGRL